jgi:hypothetical protein
MPTLEHDLQTLGGAARRPLGQRLTVAVLLDTSVLIAAAQRGGAPRRLSSYWGL